jgi:hypothetical protein
MRHAVVSVGEEVSECGVEICVQTIRFQTSFQSLVLSLYDMLDIRTYQITQL